MNEQVKGLVILVKDLKSRKVKGLVVSPREKCFLVVMIKTLMD